MNGEPICGWQWYIQNKDKYTQADIDRLTIVMSVNGKDLPAIRQNKGDKGIVKDLVKSYRKERG